MANFSVAAAAFFCFVTLSLALTPQDTPEIDDATTETSLTIPDASNPSVPVNAHDNPPSLSTPVPLTTTSLRQFNRRFSKSLCHHRRKFYKPDPMRPFEIPYGNDMLVSSGENSDFQDPEALHGGSLQRVKLHHYRFHHHHHDDDSDSDSDDEDEDDRIKKMGLKRRHFGGLDAEKKLKKHFRHENTEEDNKKERDGFMIRVRKFFHHYF